MTEHVWLIIIIFSHLTRLIHTWACNSSCWTWHLRWDEGREEYEWIKRWMWESEVILDPKSDPRQNPHTFKPFFLSFTPNNKPPFIPFIPHTHSSSHCLKFHNSESRRHQSAESFELRRPTLRYLLAGRFCSLPHSLLRPPLIANRRFLFESLFNSLIAPSQLHVLTFWSNFQFSVGFFKALFSCFHLCMVDFVLGYAHFCVLGDCRGKLHGCSPWMFGRFSWSG